ncbi:urea transporter 1 isoform X2 [Anguilla rostrata]|uniref:urea transporter 1 isoform X2 n=1 Tax=Anguilla rostrata TaxID=7938 RepID=UPI0030D03009
MRPREGMGASARTPAPQTQQSADFAPRRSTLKSRAWSARPDSALRRDGRRIPDLSAACSTVTMWVSDKGAPPDGPGGRGRRVLRALLLCTGDMAQLRKSMDKQPFLLQLVEWSLRGVSRVILANNPLSGAVILGALLMHSPWQALLGLMGLLASTLTALIIGQDSTFLFSGLSALLDRWDLPVSVFPFNTAILLYLACTGPTNPYFPHHPATPPGALQDTNATLHIPQLLQGVVLGVGQIYACGTLWPSVLILAAVLLFSPLLCVHALLGSAAGTLAGLSVAVRPSSLYSGLSGFNGALGCMSVGGLFFTISWKTHLFSLASAFLSAYADIALSNLLATVALPACSWAATLTATLMLLLTAQNLSSYRIPMGRVTTPEQNLRTHGHWTGGTTESTDV